MPIVTLNPVSQGTYMEWETLVGSTRPGALSDASDATSIQQAAASDPFPTPIRDSFFLDGIQPIAMASVNTVSGFGRTGVANHQMNAYFRIGSTDGSGTEGGWSDPVIGDHGGTRSRPGGGAWTPADVTAANLQIVCVVQDSDGSQTSVFYKAWAEVDFNSSNGFIAFITQLVLPVVGAGLGLHEMPAVMRFLRRRLSGRFRFEPEEERAILEELRRPRRLCFG